MSEADLAGALRLSRASGWNQTLADWRLLLSLGPGLFRVGLESDQIVASGGAVRYAGALAWICMILVDPSCRGRGLGTRVLAEVLSRLKRLVEKGELAAVGLDATPEGRPLYAQQGFVEAAALVRMGAPAARGSAARSPAAVRPMRPADVPAVLALDREVFGADRSPLLRHALASAADLARVAPHGRELRGFCLGRHGEHSDHLGPVVGDAQTARELVAACRSGRRDRPLIVDARVTASWIAELEALGFRVQRPFTRMYLGDPRPPARPGLEHAIRGPEFG